MELNLLGFVSFLLLLLSFSPSVSSLNSDGLSLLALKAAITTDPTHILHTWFDSDSTPCNWVGITCFHGRVTEIYLPNKSFNGYIPSELGAILSLRRISLSHNNFTKPIPSRIFNASHLIYLDLSHNSLTGPIPEEIKTVKALIHLDLSSNLLNGSLPEGISELQDLAGTLNLSNNRFSGHVPASFGKFPVTVSLDLRYNNFTGKIPEVGSLLNQGPTAFTGNPNLCGFPLQTPCPNAQNPEIFVNPVNPKNTIPNFPNGANPQETEKSRGSSAVIPIISGVSCIIGAVSVSMWLFRKKWKSGEGKMKREKFEKEGEEDEAHKGKFMVMDEGFALELEDLLRASAYVVGKSQSGIVYKVVVGRGSGGVALAPAPAVVAVRRLSEVGGVWRIKEFESEVEAIGSVCHPNIVRLRAYYYASDEKLLISDFINNGSLYSALHGGPSNSLPPLSWAARLKIAEGVARGLMYIHECSPRKYVHGNIKSSKILLDYDFHPFISGFGLTHLITATSKSTEPSSKKQNSTQIVVTPRFGSKFSASISSSMYLAPEARNSGTRLAQKCDVYSYGIVLMEILTGRVPDAGTENDGKGLESFVRKAFREEKPLSEIIDQALLHEVYAKKQVLAAFHVALNCTELDPEMRPRMRNVLESLDRVRSH